MLVTCFKVSWIDLFSFSCSRALWSEELNELRGMRFLYQWLLEHSSPQKLHTGANELQIAFIFLAAMKNKFD